MKSHSAEERGHRPLRDLAKASIPIRKKMRSDFLRLFQAANVSIE